MNNGGIEAKNNQEERLKTIALRSAE